MPPTPADAAERNRQLARELFDAITRADVARLDQLYADDFELWTAGSLPFSGSHDTAEALEGMKMIASMFPRGLRFTISGMTAEGERVAVEAESDGVHASGRPYHNQYHFLMIVRDGKIRKFKEYMDTVHATDVLIGGEALAAGRPA
jgi:ketosteroid isomerase-like protein